MDFKKPKELEVDYIDIRYPSRYGKYVYISSFFGDNRLLVVDETLYEYIKHISLEDIYKVSVTHTGNSEEVISVLLQIKKGVYEENE